MFWIGQVTSVHCVSLLFPLRIFGFGVARGRCCFDLAGRCPEGLQTGPVVFVMSSAPFPQDPFAVFSPWDFEDVAELSGGRVSAKQAPSPPWPLPCSDSLLLTVCLQPSPLFACRYHIVPGARGRLFKKANFHAPVLSPPAAHSCGWAD